MDKIYYSLLLHALGDTIGFKNGDWEFNYQQEEIDTSFTFELASEFIYLGGINKINLKEWKVSDDTVLHLETADALTKSTSLGEFIKQLIKNFRKSLENIKERYPGFATVSAIEKLFKDPEYKKYPFNKTGGGSGASMRSSCVGLMFHDDVEKLIKYSVEGSYITHNHPTGYLGGIVASLFTSYAYRNVPVEEWPFKMLQLIKSDMFDNLMKQHVDYDVYTSYKHSFIGLWKVYIDDKFDDNKKIKKVIRNLALRSKYFIDNISYKTNYIGTSGDDSVIVAYDSFLDAGDSFEKLIFYSMLHIGDTDTTGCIAGSFYGAMYGEGDVPSHLLQNIEYKSDIKRIAEKLSQRVNKI